MVELDVLRPRGDFGAAGEWTRASAGPARASGPLLVAHDWGDARRREPHTLAEALDAFTAPPLDRVEIDLDLKTIGREDEAVAALRERDLIARAMASTMEQPSLLFLRDHHPELRRGWTLPRVRRDWRRSRLAKPVLGAGMAALRARLPGLIRRRAPELGVWSAWVHHPFVTPRLLAAADEAGIAILAWTVDTPERVAELSALGVDGIVSNDPRLLAQRRGARGPRARRPG